MASDYRKNIIKSIGNDIKIPSVIAEEIGLRTNHVSNVLNDLKSKNIVVCLNEEARKGRLYKNTDLGLTILKYIE
jgi:predicted transcriptional regulator